MQSAELLLTEPAELEQRLGSNNLLIVDLCKPEIYAQAHIPGAVHLDYSQIVAARPPAMGLLPDEAHLSAILGRLGVMPDMFVIAYDDEGGGRASRLLWTLDVVSHARRALLNGGLHAWAAENRPLSAKGERREAGPYPVTLNGDAAADKDYVLGHLNDPAVTIVDTRSPAEYSGMNKRAERAGHIPGAVNFDWVGAIDHSRNLRLRPEAELRSALATLGITPDKEIITYCQTHHRSAHTYIVLKSLGYPNVKGYAGSWSEWGNSPDTPIA